jgi:hypothetical protein
MRTKNKIFRIEIFNLVYNILKHFIIIYIRSLFFNLLFIMLIKKNNNNNNNKN